MGKLAFLRMFIFVSLNADVYDNRRHIHIFKGTGQNSHSVAKIWIEKQGKKHLEIAESSLSSKENKLILETIDKNWEFLNNQITKSFNGEKLEIKNLAKK